MKRLNYIWFAVLMIVLPIGIVMLSGNLVMRTSVTYVYHFNDSQAVSRVGSSVTGSEFADDFAGYFNSISRDEFQVYEVNGEFRDPIFDEEESLAMSRAKNIMTVTLLSGIVFMGIAVAIYLYLVSSASKQELRIIGYISLGLSAGAVLITDFLASMDAIRGRLFNRFIDVSLNEKSTLRILLGSPFEKTYIIFSTVLAVAIICVLIYIHHSITRERRMFS